MNGYFQYGKLHSFAVILVLYTYWNTIHSLPSLQLAKPLLPTTFYTYNHYRYNCKSPPIVFCLMTMQTSLCTCLYINVWTSTRVTSLYYITFFVERYINKTISLLLTDTSHSPPKQCNYSLSRIL